MSIKIKILVSGLTGFVGSNFEDYLNSEYKILSFGRHSSLGMITEANTVLHLAGKAHDLESVTNADEYYAVNYDFTKIVYDAFLVSTASKFIFLSSVKAVADHADHPLNEDFPTDPNTHYGRSKLLAEQYIQSQPLPEGKSYYILRPCMIHGPGNKGNLNLLYKFASKGIPYPLANFENKRSFLSVENLCFVIKQLIERNDIPSGIYHVADDEALSTNELVSLIGLVSGRPAKLWHISRKLIFALAKIGDFLKLPLTTERLNKLTENYLVDNSKIRAALGKELPINARDGIAFTIQSFQNQAKQ